MPVELNLRFGLRSLFVAVAFCAVVIAVIVGAVRPWIIEKFIRDKVTSLNGGVGKNYQVHFSVGGLRPLVADKDLKELAPYLAEFGVRSVVLRDTRISDSGLRSLVDSCHSTLESLEIDGTDISDEGLVILSICPNLKHITVSASQLSDKGIEALAEIDSLRSIVVIGGHVNDDRLSRLRDTLGDGIAVKASEKSNL
jgi:hypothetical protein